MLVNWIVLILILILYLRAIFSSIIYNIYTFYAYDHVRMKLFYIIFFILFYIQVFHHLYIVLKKVERRKEDFM